MNKVSKVPIRKNLDFKSLYSKNKENFHGHIHYHFE